MLLAASWCEVVAPSILSSVKWCKRRQRFVPRDPAFSERGRVRAALMDAASGSLSLAELSAITGLDRKRIGAALAREQHLGSVISFYPLSGRFYRYRWVK